MLVLKGFIVIPDSDLDAVQKELENHKRLTLEEPGCNVFEVVQSSDNPYRFDVYEEFINIKSFEDHQLRVKASFWGKVSANVERHYKILS